MTLTAHPATPILAKLSEYYNAYPLLDITLHYLCKLAERQGTTYILTDQDWRTENALAFLQQVWTDSKGLCASPGTPESYDALEHICNDALEAA